MSSPRATYAFAKFLNDCLTDEELKAGGNDFLKMIEEGEITVSKVDLLRRFFSALPRENEQHAATNSSSSSTSTTNNNIDDGEEEEDSASDSEPVDGYTHDYVTASATLRPKRGFLDKPEYEDDWTKYPVGLSLQKYAYNYPNSLVGRGLDPFIRLNFGATHIWEMVDQKFWRKKGYMNSDFLVKRLLGRYKELWSAGLDNLFAQPITFAVEPKKGIPERGRTKPLVWVAKEKLKLEGVAELRGRVKDSVKRQHGLIP